ncbi:saccharopine dehydrogenase NADP-binding domain-containing protein [Saccharothrix deserti]|uniref:saccharopine dehydrogenase NADP-binding domain-containing protein n=1 Tax=Saccharothrix deserti TaxID=2593674 RepID=UPI00131E773F|nr:saccharopine dehydrogenase NADP-binding domain-containing protein [Saccharothrix deserti]
MARIVIFGGYGAVGREAAAVLSPSLSLSPSHEVVVAGRNPAKAVPGTTTLRVDLRDDADVQRALDGTYAVLMCAEVDNARIARACLERGVHYVDVTASRRTVSAIQALDGDATALLSVGLAPGVTNLLARHAVELTGARDVEIGVLLGSDGFAVTVSAGGVTCAFSGRRQSRATSVVAALLVNRLPALPNGVWHVDQVVDPVEFLTEAAGHGFHLHLPPTMQHDGTATSSSTA